MGIEAEPLSKEDSKALEALLRGKTLGQLKAISGRLNAVWRLNLRAEDVQLAGGFQTGDRVRWYKKGISYTGTVTGINTRSLSVKADDGVKWKIGFTCCARI